MTFLEANREACLTLGVKPSDIDDLVKHADAGDAISAGLIRNQIPVGNEARCVAAFIVILTKLPNDPLFELATQTIVRLDNEARLQRN